MPLTLGGISYTQLTDGSGEGSRDDSKVEQTESYLCAWTDHVALMTLLLGTVAEAGGEIVVVPPNQHPTYTTLRCTAVSVKPHGKPTGTFSWERAILVAKYTRPDAKNDSTDPYDLVSESLDFSSEIFSYPPESFSSDGQPIGAVQVIVPKVEYTLTLSKQPTLPLAAIIGVLGKLNESSFAGAGVGQMLFLGASSNRKTTSEGVQAWETTYKFLYGTRDHRESRTDAGWVKVKFEADDSYIYELGDFSTLKTGK